MTRINFEFGGIKEREYGSRFVDYEYGAREFRELTRMLDDYGIRVVSSEASYDHSDPMRSRLKSLKIKGFLPDSEEPKILEILVKNRAVNNDDFQITSPEIRSVCGYAFVEMVEGYVLKDVARIVKKCAKKRTKKINCSSNKTNLEPAPR